MEDICTTLQSWMGRFLRALESSAICRPGMSLIRQISHRHCKNYNEVFVLIIASLKRTFSRYFTVGGFPILDCMELFLKVFGNSAISNFCMINYFLCSNSVKESWRNVYSWLFSIPTWNSKLQCSQLGLSCTKEISKQPRCKVYGIVLPGGLQLSWGYVSHENVWIWADFLVKNAKISRDPPKLHVPTAVGTSITQILVRILPYFIHFIYVLSFQPFFFIITHLFQWLLMCLISSPHWSFNPQRRQSWCRST